MFLRRFHYLFVAVFLFCFIADVAEARNPPPTFETDYTLPVIEPPGSETPWTYIMTVDAVVVGLYALFLLLAGLAVHRWRSRKFLFCLAVCSVVILGFKLYGCPCPVGMFQNIVQVFVDPAIAVPWTVILLFTLPLLAALFFGRIFCSSVCPLGAVQELTAMKNLKIPDRVEQTLGLLRYILLGIGVFCVVVGFGFVLCAYDPFTPFFHRGALYSVVIFAFIVLGIGFVVGRPFCRFLCPYGALLGICGSLAARKVSITPGECDQCKLCEHVCPYNAILSPTKEPTPQEKRSGSLERTVAIFALPILVFVFALIGNAVAPRFAPLNLDIHTAQRLYLEEAGWVEVSGTFPETRGLVQLGTPSEKVYQRAIEAHKMFGVAGTWLGVWIGLVIGIKWILLTLRRRQIDYEVDPARCFACGRCFWYCPNQKGERLLLTLTIPKHRPHAG